MNDPWINQAHCSINFHTITICGSEFQSVATGGLVKAMDTVRGFVFHILFPWRFMLSSARGITSVISAAIMSRDYAPLLSLDAFCDALFGRFWSVFEPVAKMHAEVRVIPLLEGRVSAGKIRDEKVHEPVRGLVLEVGAGSGNWVDVFLKIGTKVEISTAASQATLTHTKSNTDGITKIFGVEPQPESVRTLGHRVQELGMGNIYEVLPMRIESLSDSEACGRTAIEPESIDSIVTVLCLCSISDQESNIKALYKLLKPGGRWYVYERVRIGQSGVSGYLLGVYQSIPSSKVYIFEPH